MEQKIFNFLTEEKATAAAEYAIMVAIAATVALTVFLLGNRLIAAFTAASVSFP